MTSSATSCEDMLREHFWASPNGDISRACASLQNLGPSIFERRLESPGGDGCPPESDGFAKFQTLGDWVNLGVSLACVFGAALAAGLTMSVVSLEEVDLRLKMKHGDAGERQCAKKLLPLTTLQPRHRVMVTLLLCNSVFNETLPLFLDKLVPSWAAVLVSVSGVLIFGEIIPTAIFTGPNRYKIAAAFTGLVRAMLLLLSPIALPISWVLDSLIPHQSVAISKKEVYGLVEIHRQIAREDGRAEPFNFEEEAMVKGALSLNVKAADTVTTPLSKVFSLSLDDVLDQKTMQTIIESGYSRVCVHAPEDKECLLGYILVKEHLLLSPRESVKVSSLDLYLPVVAHPKLSLSALLNEFQDGSSHMAFVAQDPKMLRQAMVRHPMHLANSRSFSLPSQRHFDTNFFSDGEDYENGAASAHTPTQTPISSSSLSLSPPTSPLPFTEAAEAATSRLLTSIKRSQVVGIVTLEDVIEELLAEEVYDEGDRRNAEKSLSTWVRDKALPILRAKAAFRRSLTTAKAKAAETAAGNRGGQQPQQLQTGEEETSDAVRGGAAGAADEETGAGTPTKQVSASEDNPGLLNPPSSSLFPAVPPLLSWRGGLRLGAQGSNYEKLPAGHRVGDAYGGGVGGGGGGLEAGRGGGAVLPSRRIALSKSKSGGFSERNQRTMTAPQSTAVSRSRRMSNKFNANTTTTALVGDAATPTIAVDTAAAAAAAAANPASPPSAHGDDLLGNSRVQDRQGTQREPLLSPNSPALAPYS